MKPAHIRDDITGLLLDNAFYLRWLAEKGKDLEGHVLSVEELRMQLLGIAREIEGLAIKQAARDEYERAAQ